MKKGSIFISVASYRDKICPVTIESIYKNARHPNKVFVGICQQNADGDTDCFEKGLASFPQYRNNVRILRLRHNEARGPTYARYLCSTLYHDEEYYLQIDSHCRFIRNWDVILIKMIMDLKAMGVSKPVLSTYTPGYEDYTETPDSNSPVTTICQAWFTDQNLISLLGAGWTAPEDLPRPNAYIAAGMLFAEAKFLQEIPFDPELDFVFVGEELLLSVRFYTNGWDIYTPNQNVIYHMYTREKDPKFWDNKHINSDQALKKVRYILNLDTDISQLTPRQIESLKIYGLGKERTIDEYMIFAGIDLTTKKVNKNLCELDVAQIAITTFPPQKKEKIKKKKHTHWWVLYLIIIILILICILIWIITKNTKFQKIKSERS
jgi:hypothetical protein